MPGQYGREQHEVGRDQPASPGPSVGACRAFPPLEEAPDVRGEPLALADDPDPDIGSVQVGEVVAHETLEEAHQVGDLLGGPAPVLGGEAVQGEIADADLAGGTDGAPDGLDAAPVSLDPRQAAPRRPAAVAVHDDGDMGREPRSRIGGAGLGREKGFSAHEGCVHAGRLRPA